MKKILFGALIIFIIGEIIIFYDSRQLEAQVGKSGIINDFHADVSSDGAQIWLNDRLEGVHQLKYRNQRKRDVCINDSATLVIIERMQYLYYGSCDLNDVRNDDFMKCSGLWSAQILLLLLVVIFFRKK